MVKELSKGSNSLCARGDLVNDIVSLKGVLGSCNIYHVKRDANHFAQNLTKYFKKLVGLIGSQFVM